MKTPAKSPKTPTKTTKKSSLDWLSLGFICLLVGGTIGAKTLLLIDNDLEIKTKFSGKTWQLNSQSIEQYVNLIEKFASQQLHPLGEEVRQQSSQIIARTGDALASQQDLCISTSQFSTVLAHAKSLNPVAVDHPTPTKADLPPAAPNRKVLPISRSIPTKNPVQTNPVDRDWCITTGVKK